MAWRTVVTIFINPGGLWVWSAAPPKPPDHLPGSCPPSPEVPFCTSLSRTWFLSQGQVALFVCPWLGPPWQHCFGGLSPSGREVPGSWAAALRPWASCKWRTFYRDRWHVFWPPTFWKEISLSVGCSTCIHYSFKKLAEYIQQHQHHCQQHLLSAYYAPGMMMSAREVGLIMMTWTLALCKAQSWELCIIPPFLK